MCKNYIETEICSDCSMGVIAIVLKDKKEYENEFKYCYFEKEKPSKIIENLSKHIDELVGEIWEKEDRLSELSNLLL
jgi:hypothetical protein